MFVITESCSRFSGRIRREKYRGCIRCLKSSCELAGSATYAPDKCLPGILRRVAIVTKELRAACFMDRQH